MPISEKQLPPVLRRKADEIEDNKPSKHQIKKEKKAERKEKRQRQRKNANSLFNNQVTPEVSLQTKSDSESDADIEDNIDVRDSYGGLYMIIADKTKRSLLLFKF